VRDARARRQGDLPERHDVVAVRAVWSHVTGLAPRHAAAGDAPVRRAHARVGPFLQDDAALIARAGDHRLRALAPNTFQLMQPRDDEPSPVAVRSLEIARNYREIITPIAA